MRLVDKRLKVGRRGFMQAGSTALPAAALATAGMGISAQAAWATAAQALSPHAMATLVLMSRDIYPHDHFPDSLYVAAAKPWDEKAASDATFKQMIETGTARLDADAGDRFAANYLAVPWEEDRVSLLHGIAQTAFFKKCRSDLVVSLYNQPAVWTRLGYEGSSAEHGGYIHRGFDDIDWLSSV